VLLIERRQYPADKLCGEFLSYDGVACLREMELETELKKRRARPIASVLVSSEDGTYWQGALPAMGIGISRRVLDAMLADACRQVGVEVVHGVQVREIRGDWARGYVAEGRQGEYFSGRLVIGACGRQGGIFKERDAQHHGAKLMALKVQASCGEGPGRIELHGFPGGYAGLCSIEGGLATLGLMTRAEDFQRVGGEAERFAAEVMRQNPLLAERLDRLKPCWEEALAVAALRFGYGETAREGVLLVGDAAGSINPLCGDGMSMALRGGGLLASLADRFLQGTVSGQVLVGKWDRVWRREFRRRIQVGSLLEKALLRPTWSRLALKSFNTWPWLGQAVLRWSRG
jgi:flavin-dependent dehydrogenase